MTTPQTPAGWYPDPDGSGGQRYWDGSAWTEHRAPALEQPQAAAEPRAPAEPPASEQPTAVVPTWTASTEHVGAHRRPEPDDEPEPTAQATEPVAQPAAPDLPPAFETPPSFETPSPPADLPPAFETPQAFQTPPPSGPLPPAPVFGTPPPDAPTADGGNRGKVITWYGAACAVLLLILLGVVIYGFFIKDDPGVQLATPGSSPSAETSAEPSESSESSATATDSPTTRAESGDATDGPLSFTVHGVEVGSTVVMADAPIEKNAQGEYIVVHMTVTNVGDEATSFVGMFQTLNAGGTTYNIDDEATAYLEGTFADLEPGTSADVSIAFDVPPGTEAESIDLHADPSTPGVQVSLS